MRQLLCNYPPRRRSSMRQNGHDTPDVWPPWAIPMSLMRSPDDGAAGESFRVALRS